MEAICSSETVCHKWNSGGTFPNIDSRAPSDHRSVDDMQYCSAELHQECWKESARKYL